MMILTMSKMEPSISRSYQMTNDDRTKHLDVETMAKNDRGLEGEFISYMLIKGLLFRTSRAAKT